MPLLLIGGAALLLSGGYAADKIGEGINDSGTGALKLAVAGVALYYVSKKAGWL